MSKINFTKMHALGNDFVIIDAITQIINLEKLPIPRLAHRHVGIGFDQLLIVSNSKNGDFSCQIFNADGSEAEQCGNGIRCVARFIFDNKLSEKLKLDIETKAGIIETEILYDGAVKVNMGFPCFDPPLIPFLANEMKPSYSLEVKDRIIDLMVLSMGNPHAIMQVPSVIDAPVFEVGEALMRHKLFPKGVNIGFMEVVSPEHICLRTFERGVGETYACGSNACAAVVAGMRQNLLNKTVNVELALGNLQVDWNGDSSPVTLIGPATKVFDGSI